MSRLFDALQRSGAEQSGIEYDDVISMVTEVFDAPQKEEWPANALAELEAAASVLPKQYPASAALTERLQTQEDVVSADFRWREVSPKPANELVCFTEPNGLAAEKFRFLGVRLRQLQRTRPLKKVLITSTIPQEGKSTVAGNLACTLARRGQQKTLLLDGDLRRPSLSKLFGLGAIPGVCEWLQLDGDPRQFIYQIEGSSLWILPAGSSPQNALELMQSPRLSALMQKLTTWFDSVIIDSPPVLPLGDTSVWMRMADGVLLVTRQGVTDKNLLKKGISALEPSKLLGTVLNASTKTVHSDYYYQAPVKS
jgi:capsular exopolysaccharide synthesis family protein